MFEPDEQYKHTATNISSAIVGALLNNSDPLAGDLISMSRFLNAIIRMQKKVRGGYPDVDDLDVYLHNIVQSISLMYGYEKGRNKRFLEYL